MPRVTADTPLTAKQTRFAAAIAQGTRKAAALRQEYAHDPARKDANQRKALELAAKPHVAAEIRRLTWLSCPPVDDVRGMREHAVRVLSDLSRTAKSEEVRLKSALALYRIAETTRAAASPTASDSEQDKLLASLRKLYGEVKGAEGTGQDLAPLVRYDDEAIDIDTVAEPLPEPPFVAQEDAVEGAVEDGVERGSGLAPQEPARPREPDRGAPAPSALGWSGPSRA